MAAVQLQLARSEKFGAWRANEDLLSGREPQDARRILDELATTELACDYHMPGFGDFPETTLEDLTRDPLRSPLPRRLAEDPDVWCFVARERTALMAAALQHKPFLDEGERYTVARAARVAPHPPAPACSMALS